MRVFRRRALGLAIPLLAFFSLPARSQNLLVNPGFDRDLSGWTVSAEFYPPANVDASAQWDGTGSPGGTPGSVRFRLNAGRQTINRVLLSQCFAASPGKRYTGGGLVRTDDQLQFGVVVRVELFPTAGCSGSAVTSSSAGSLPPAGFTHNNSAGVWLPASASALAVADAQSVRFSAGIDAVTASWYSFSSFDGLFDDAYLIEAPDPAPTWILPSSARTAGNGGGQWTTTVTLANPGADALVTLKFLGHDVDGRAGDEKSVLLRGGSVLEDPDILGTLFGRTQDFGAIQITSSSNVVVQSETSTRSLGGTVGQALPAFGPADYASASPKSLAPIRENSAFRTNLVLANPTEIPVTVHVALFAADSTPVGAQDVPLAALGMTQLTRVAALLGAAPLDVGRIAVSTPTPGGLVAAYASVIDNGTNDPRTLLPRDGADESPAPPGPNVLSNSGFDRDLSGWTIATETYPASLSDAVSAAWTSADASGLATSGGLALHADVGYHQSAQRSLSQCVVVPGGDRLASFGAKVRTAEQFGEAGVAVDLTTFASDDCSGDAFGTNTATSLGLTGYPYLSSNGAWLRAPMMVVAPAAARSARLSVRVFAVGNGYYWSGWVDAVVDDVYATFAAAALVTTILPSAAWIGGAAGSFWTTAVALVNGGASDAAVTLKFLGHDSDGRGGAEFAYIAPAGATLTDANWGARGTFTGMFGAVLATSSSPSVRVVSETSSWVQRVGSVGQALPAFGPADYAGAVAKTLAPIRENASFRTNLVLANPTEIPVTVHVALFAADSTPVGAQDVPLAPLGMTQLTRVAALLGAPNLDLGRISVSTPTPGGLVAAYASVIDNVTNDPRTLLPR